VAFCQYFELPVNFSSFLLPFMAFLPTFSAPALFIPVPANFLVLLPYLTDSCRAGASDYWQEVHFLSRGGWLISRKARTLAGRLKV